MGVVRPEFSQEAAWVEAGFSTSPNLDTSFFIQCGVSKQIRNPTPMNN